MKFEMSLKERLFMTGGWVACMVLAGVALGLGIARPSVNFVLGGIMGLFVCAVVVFAQFAEISMDFRRLEKVLASWQNKAASPQQETSDAQKIKIE